eukprot:983131-Pelagomonas_calceolata.AAC.1
MRSSPVRGNLKVPPIHILFLVQLGNETIRGKGLQILQTNVDDALQTPFKAQALEATVCLRLSAPAHGLYYSKAVLPTKFKLAHTACQE